MKRITSTVLILSGFLFFIPAYPGDTEPVTNNEVCEWQVDNAESLNAEVCTCDDAYDYLEDYLGSRVDPQEPDEIDRLVKNLQGACPCDMDIEREIPVGLRLMDILVKNGIPFGFSLDSVTRVCDLRAQGISALNRAFSPGVSQWSGGPGGEVSPN